MAATFQDPRKNAAFELFSVICCNGGGMELGFAISRLSPQSREVVNRTGGSKFVSECDHLLKLEKDGVVKAILPLKFCPQASEKGGCSLGRSCRKLHLCPYNIKGSCSYGEKCRRSHNINDEHTVSILREFGIVKYIDNIITLQKLLRNVVDDTEIDRGAENRHVPDICTFYNTVKGCSKGDRCPFLHVCQHFVNGTCKFGGQCRRVHHFQDQHNINVLESHHLNGLELEILLHLLNGRERKHTTSSSSDMSEKNMHIPAAGKSAASTSSADTSTTHGSHTATNAICIKDDDTADICGFHLCGHCYYGNTCQSHHTELPYLWQYKELNTQGPWKSLISDMNMMVEQAFCNEDKDGISLILNGVQYHIHFDVITAIPLSVTSAPNLNMRRLSTQSSVNAPPDHVYSTRWFWYWKDQKNQWQSYDSPDAGVSPNTTCQQSIEKDFLAGQSTHSFSAAIHKYTLYLKTTPMYQENNATKIKRDARRRPEFVSKQNMKEVGQRRKASVALTSPSADSSITTPSHWDPIPNGHQFARVTLSTVSEEYKKVETQFLQSLASEPKRIIKIERVQNPDLWTEFMHKKARMTKKAKKSPEERQLFHGTSNDIVPAICQQGFDWRMCGRHGTAYGKGSYFACTSSYSHRYTDHSTVHGKENHMFLARVLVGSYVLGNSSTVRPPPKDPRNPHGELCDSCVNDVNSPSLFVVFEIGQSYPEYLITYGKDSCILL